MRRIIHTGNKKSCKRTLKWIEELNIEADGLADEAKLKVQPKENSNQLR